MNQIEIDRYGWFVEFEKKHGLFNWRIKGAPVWEYIRDEVWFLIRRYYKNEETKRSVSFLKSNEDESLYKLFKYGGYFDCKQSDVLFANHPRRVWRGNERVSPYIDGLVDGIEYSWQVMEPGSRINLWGEVNTKNVFYFNPGGMTCKFRIDKETDRRVNGFISMIEKSFNIKLTENDREGLFECVISAAQNRKRFMMYYYHLLKKIRPKAIVFMMGEFQAYQYLMAAANQLGIATIEYEHYYGNGAHILDYYPKLDHPLEGSCRYRWCRGELPILHGDYKHLPIPNENLFAIGNAYVEDRISHVRETMKYKSNRGKKKIVFISDSSVYTDLYKVAIDLADRLKESDFSVLFKLHPDEEQNWREKYPDLVTSSVVVVGERRNGDIFDFVSSAYCVVGTMSTALKDSIELDKMAFIYSKAANSHVEAVLVDNGCAKWFESVDELIELLPKAEGYSPPTYPYKKNAVYNANKALKTIIGR